MRLPGNDYTDEPINQINFISTDLHKDIKQQGAYSGTGNKRKKITVDILSYNTKCIK